ncbi:MAG TPA: hypothetical protein VFJ06_14405 [Halococcus sp.]|nr:hypothetical protein [Halococcus sp.]
MTQVNKIPATKPDVYEACRAGAISEEEARNFFKSDWEDVCQLYRVENILDSQPDPEVDSSDLFR